MSLYAGLGAFLKDLLNVIVIVVVVVVLKNIYDDGSITGPQGYWFEGYRQRSAGVRLLHELLGFPYTNLYKGSYTSVGSSLHSLESTRHEIYPRFSYNAMCVCARHV